MEGGGEKLGDFRLVLEDKGCKLKLAELLSFSY